MAGSRKVPGQRVTLGTAAGIVLTPFVIRPGPSSDRTQPIAIRGFGARNAARSSKTSLCFGDLYDASRFEILVGSLTVRRNSIISIIELVR